MRIPRDLGGADLAHALCRHWGYQKVNQVGSHIIVQTDAPSSHRIAIPAHTYLRIGTLHAILRAVADHKGVTREEIVNTL